MSSAHTNHVDHELPDFIHGALDEATSANVRAHLSECATCREEEQKLRILLAAVDRHHPPQPPTGYYQTILPRVRQRLEKPSWTSIIANPFLSRLLFPSVSAAVIILAFLMVFRSAGNDSAMREAVAGLESGQVLDALSNDELYRLWNGQRIVEDVVSERTLNEQIVSDLLSDVVLVEVLDPATGSHQVLVSDFTDRDIELVIQRLSKKEIL
jgi:anti-sigma factor RsiW